MRTVDCYVVQFNSEVIGHFTTLAIAIKSVNLTWSKSSVEWMNEKFTVPNKGEGKITLQSVEVVEVFDRVEHM